MKGLVLVTGANGFVGSHVVEALLKADCRVRCLLRSHSQPKWIETLPVDIVRGDYFDPNSLRGAVKGAESIVHLAGATKAKDEAAYFKANAKTTKVLLDAAVDTCPDLKLFLHCSSQAALGPSPSMDPLTEEAPPNPLTPYGRSKLEAEKICRRYEDKFPITVMRPPAVYGPRDKDILIFFRFMKWGLSPSIGGGNRYLSMITGMDLANACRLILDENPGGFNVYHITDGAIHSWDDISRTIAEVMDRKPLRLKIPISVAAAVGKFTSGWASVSGRTATLNSEKLEEILTNFWLMSSDKIEKQLGFKAQYSLREGVEATVKWYRQKRWL
jgi:nucleoside-diphosphate-sugar epimerase